MLAVHTVDRGRDAVLEGVGHGGVGTVVEDDVGADRLSLEDQGGRAAWRAAGDQGQEEDETHADRRCKSHAGKDNRRFKSVWREAGLRITAWVSRITGRARRVDRCPPGLRAARCCSSG